MSDTEILFRVDAPDVSFEEKLGSALILRAGDCELRIDMPETGENVAMKIEDTTHSLKGACHG